MSRARSKTQSLKKKGSEKGGRDLFHLMLLAYNGTDFIKNLKIKMNADWIGKELYMGTRGIIH